MSSERLHTLIVSDLHLTDAELGLPGRSLWKRYKRPKFFIDRTFRDMLMAAQVQIRNDRAELILNGDIFDFDSVTKIPAHSDYKISWLERKRGLYPEEKKSLFKIETILNDHDVWVQALQDWVSAGHSVVFIIGNHDVELNWPSVQHAIMSRLNQKLASDSQVRFCEWFYLSHQDTLIEHGNQHDDYCVNINPIHPFVKKGRRIFVRLPFGNVSSRMMINGMGLFNPHVESTFLMNLREYVQFFYKYALRVQPFLAWTWLWSAGATFLYALGDGLLPSMKDPLFFEQRIQEIATKSQVAPHKVHALRELHTHSAIFNPFKIARELWLDRLVLVVGVVLLSFQFFALFYFLKPISVFWWILSLFLLVPILFYYTKNIKSEVLSSLDEVLKQAPLLSKIAHVDRVVFGHTHREHHTWYSGVEVMNTGTWSPAFKNPECTESYGKKCVAWIKPKAESSSEAIQHARIAILYEWDGLQWHPMPSKKDEYHEK